MVLENSNQTSRVLEAPVGPPFSKLSLPAIPITTIILLFFFFLFFFFSVFFFFFVLFFFFFFFFEEN